MGRTRDSGHVDKGPAPSRRGARGTRPPLGRFPFPETAPRAPPRPTAPVTAGADPPLGRLGRPSRRCYMGRDSGDGRRSLPILDP